MLCTSIKGPTFEDICMQITKALRLCDIIELRLDCFANCDLESIRKIKSSFTIPMIFTLPKQTNDARGKILELCSLRPEYLDMEDQVPESFIEEVSKLYPEIKIILSHHDYEKTPDNIDEIVASMKRFRATFYKIAFYANNSIDMVRLLLHAKNFPNDDISISMGPFGAPGRIMAPCVKSPITYSCIDETLQTAPGQLTSSELIHTYHHRILNKKTQLFGLIGDPVTNSISHITHNHIFQSVHKDAVYTKMQVNATELFDFLQYAKHLFRGLSITMPLKEAVVPYIDYIDSSAKKIGAVNTLLFDNGKIFGFNTDGIGALNAFEKTTPVEGKKIVVLGAGGAAKAIIFEACRRKGNVTILNRDKSKAQEVAKAFNCQGFGLDHMQKCFDEGYDILINCTPIQMPIDPKFLLSHAVVMDIKTKPAHTEFLQIARTKGCQIVYGYEMFIEQALWQYAIWFNDDIDLKKARECLLYKCQKELLLKESK